MKQQASKSWKLFFNMIYFYCWKYIKYNELGCVYLSLGASGGILQIFSDELFYRKTTRSLLSNLFCHFNWKHKLADPENWF